MYLPFKRPAAGPEAIDSDGKSERELKLHSQHLCGGLKVGP